ncbi:MAG: TRAP transporter substrate-binding protein DctP [Rhodovibrionaceae bacterium]
MLKKLALTGLALAVFCAAAPAALAVELQFLRSWDAKYQGTAGMADTYATMVEEASGGDITFKLVGPETVPPFEQLQPVQAGVFDMLFTHGAYHAGTTSMVIGLDTVDPDPAMRREVGIWDYIDAHYQTLGMKLLSLPASGGSHFMLRNPVAEGEDFSGMKIRGTPPIHPVIEALGGSPVVMPGGEIYSSLDKGVVDGANWPVSGAVAFKWYEVSCCFMRPNFGTTAHPILINLDSWNALSAEQQAVMLEQGELLESEVRAAFTEAEKDEEAKLIELGMQRIEFGPEVWDRAAKAFVEGYWNIAASRDPEAAEEMRSMASEAGLIFE